MINLENGTATMSDASILAFVCGKPQTEPSATSSRFLGGTNAQTSIAHPIVGFMYPAERLRKSGDKTRPADCLNRKNYRRLLGRASVS